MKSNRGLLTLFALGMSALACAIPGLQTTGSVPPPTPDTRLDQMVAETVSAALQLTQQAAPSTAEPNTPTPEPTFTPTAVAAIPAETEESVLEKNSDGSNTFIDIRGKYQITIPAEWLSLRANSPEYLEAGLLPEAANPAIQRSLSAINSQDPDIFRLFMLDINEERIDGGFVTNVNVLWDQNMETAALNQEEIKLLADDLASSLGNAEVLATELRTTKNGIPYGLIVTRSRILSPEGANLVIIQKLIFFDAPVGTLNITLSTTEKWQETVEPSFDAIIESFIVLE